MDWKPNAAGIKQDFDRDGYIIILKHLSAEEDRRGRGERRTLCQGSPAGTA